ncbi:Triose-phosphate isomerase [Gluconacetobacter diazotrophicus PA1 5]|uniref:Triosephosphate isomerase n=2 Tax=Gluconacetobacter diazotrophicus TaxID=33996 RepID=TPIS_GLUDA|nr:triose-phosphate isomerase [Gluconacetobacter diazotrophicus]A9HJ86.1 RecName: Full=Triosephosphate isomerase; Short=TIM; Short=TPI; AltName: Full=Triose-phosphate isomerase [Gluconacetobacter diazotrophicus PA1 5]ACI49954.1 Triose-phosphate isomerase [Gluconacetobacter diazotrophicus PA1 5]MBB2156505.1 triose-phosphate isomerase [Gluconacetobacter diazotrophicus]TWB05998.1 triosephosphate isomerase [Gluconacetobacter diazotrophicus]CAP55875.1 putative triosephosphate isomerase [Gluconaceto
MRQMIVGNWKMNGLGAPSRDLVGEIAEGLATIPSPPQVVVCPPFTQLAGIGPLLKGSGIALGAQDCHQAASGAHTGDISAAMLADLGVEYVVLGHSERRRDHGELDETVREKTQTALAAGLTPIVCIGETGDQKASGESRDAIGWQIQGSLPDGFSGVVAYEPVWAIGSGNPAASQDIADMMGFIRAELVRQFGAAGKTIRILYGGSVNGRDAASILPIAEVGGALVGSASLQADTFLPIVRAAVDL